MNKNLIKSLALYTGIAGISGAMTHSLAYEIKNSKTTTENYTIRESEIVDIPDVNLKKGINKALGRGETLQEITIAEMESLQSLTILNKNIANIKGLQYAINLHTLNLGGNNIIDISLLENLTNLKKLYLDSNKISDISYLSNLSSINNLWISSNAITDISPLEDLTRLNELRLNGNPIKDLSPLERLQTLTSLSISGSSLTDISSVGTLINLTFLNLENNQISDISPLNTLTKLKSLNLGRNQISDISPLGDLNALINLSIYFNQISDISVLENLNNLIELQIQNNLISNLSNLECLINLTTLYANNNSIEDIHVLQNLTNLTKLWLHNNSILDIGSLSNLTNLTILYLGNNQISDILVLENLTNLTNLQLYNNQISDISSLENLANLTNLQLYNNQISDISDLWNLTNLTNLQLHNNQISDISSLENLTNLTILYLGNNNISDISALSNLIKLTSLTSENNYISSISALKNLTKLNGLNLTNNQICDISSLKSLTNLTSLYLGNNNISDISVLSNLNKISLLKIGGQNITNNYTIKTNTKLTNIDLNNPIKDLNGEYVDALSISNGGYYQNNKIYWDDVVLGQSTFTSKFSQTVQINTGKTDFSGSITYNIDIVDGEAPSVENNFSVNEDTFSINVTITAEDLLSDVDYLIHKGERQSLPYTFEYDVYNRENNIIEVYDTAGNMTTHEVTADSLDLQTINNLVLLLGDNNCTPDKISYIRTIINNMSETESKDLLNDKINNLSFDLELERQNISSNVDVYIKCENILLMSLDTNSITFENFSGVDDLEKTNVVNITVNSSLPYQINAYLPTEIQNSDGSNIMDKQILNIKENSETEYKNFLNTSDKIILKDNCIAGNNINHSIDLTLKGGIAHEKDVYKTTIKLEIEQK